MRARYLGVVLTVPLLAPACRSAKQSTDPPQAQAMADHASAADAAPADPAPSAVVRPPQTIFRSELKRATARGPGWLLRQLSPQPYRPAGRFQGWQITQVFPDDPDLCAPGCDLRPGDVIITVNGNNLERPEQLSRLFEGVDDMATLEVHSLRDGESRKTSYTIALDPDAPS